MRRQNYIGFNCNETVGFEEFWLRRRASLYSMHIAINFGIKVEFYGRVRGTNDMLICYTCIMQCLYHFKLKDGYIL